MTYFYIKSYKVIIFFKAALGYSINTHPKTVEGRLEIYKG